MVASAKGLFRATGNKAKPQVVQLFDCSFERSGEPAAREKDDFYPTPPEPTQALLVAERLPLARFPEIWEPAAGDGAMAEQMSRAGYRVLLSDLVDRGCGAEIRSFYEYRDPLAPAIVTNPPFQECHGDPAWVRHALEGLKVEYMALLLPFNWPGARERAPVWAQHPPARVYLMRWRIDFTGSGSPPMLNAWFVWERGFSGTPSLLMLDKADPLQASMFDGDAA